MLTRFVAFAAIVAAALACPQPAPAATLTDNDVRGGWIADVGGQRVIYVLKVRDGRISGISCSDCANGRSAYVPPGPNEPLSPARIDGLWLTGPGATGQHVTLHQVGHQILGVICGPCDNPFTAWPIDSGIISRDTLTFNIVHEDTAFPGTTFIAAFSTEVTATLSRTEMHLRVFREDNGTTGEMTLLGPIRAQRGR